MESEVQRPPSNCFFVEGSEHHRLDRKPSTKISLNDLINLIKFTHQKDNRQSETGECGKLIIWRNFHLQLNSLLLAL